MKPKRIRLLDIDPNLVYLIPGSRKNVLTDIPVKIACTETHGWQRGFVRVDLEEGRCPKIAYATSLYTNELLFVEISRVGNELVFGTPSTHSTLHLCTADQLNSIVQSMRNTIKSKETEIEKLKWQLAILASSTAYPATSGKVHPVERYAANMWRNPD